MELTKRKYLILIAEDDEDDYLLTRDAFLDCSSDIDLEWVRDGEELMDYLRHKGNFTDTEKYQTPSMILLDLNMPRKDGREALKEIKADPKLRSIPVITLTTSNAEDDIRYAYNLGVNSYIRKPIGFDQFLNVIKIFQDYWLKTVKLPNGK